MDFEGPDAALFEFLLRMGDNTLILGHRVSEWCGHAPVLEEDIALANTALDLIGQTQMWLGLAGEVEGRGAAPMTRVSCATPGISATCCWSNSPTAISARP
jgi:1,2-phenylacetyl-CoA epoxidase catalytic subunit